MKRLKMITKLVLILCMTVSCLGYDVKAKNTTNQSISTLQIIDGSGSVRTHNITRYKGESNGSFVMYYSHSDAITYKNNLQSSYAKGLAPDLWAFVGFVLGVAASAGVLYVTRNIRLAAIAQSIISGGITSFGVWLAQKTAQSRINWMSELADRVNTVLNTCNTNVGIWISFNSNTHQYQVGIQTG